MIVEINGKFYISIPGTCEGREKECCFGPDRCDPYKISRCLDESGNPCIWSDLEVQDLRAIEDKIRSIL